MSGKTKFSPFSGSLFQFLKPINNSFLQPNLFPTGSVSNLAEISINLSLQPNNERRQHQRVSGDTLEKLIVIVNVGHSSNSQRQCQDLALLQADQKIVDASDVEIRTLPRHRKVSRDFGC